jgi:hypothetical protein
MKLSALATLALLLALPACGEDKEDTATEATNVTTEATDGMTGTDGTTAGTDGTTADATTADATTADATTMEGTTADAPTTDAPTTGEPTTGEPTTGSAGLSFATDIWAPILAKSCDCHGGGPTGGLLLGMDAATAYASMVGVASSIGMNYVTRRPGRQLRLPQGRRDPGRGRRQRRSDAAGGPRARSGAARRHRGLDRRRRGPVKRDASGRPPGASRSRFARADESTRANEMPAAQTAAEPRRLPTVSQQTLAKKSSRYAGRSVGLR